MSLKLGAWEINANGRKSTLRLDVVNDDGQVRGAFGDNRIIGIWDDTSRTLCFASENAPERVLPQFFKGFLFSIPSNPQPGQDIVWTLAGFFQVIDLQLLQLDLGNARRNVFGWFAQITEAS